MNEWSRNHLNDAVLLVILEPDDGLGVSASVIRRTGPIGDPGRGVALHDVEQALVELLAAGLVEVAVSVESGWQGDESSGDSFRRYRATRAGYRAWNQEPPEGAAP